jgi:hypothetical protein
MNAQFERAFRMELPVLQELYSLVADYLWHDPVKACQSVGQPIDPIICLDMSVWFLAGASFLDIAPLYGVSSEGFYALLHMTLQAIIKAVPVSFNLTVL